MKFKSPQFIFSILFLFILISCNKNSANPADLTSEQDGISATLTLDPINPVAMENTKITLTIEENNQPVEGAEVLFDLSMPGMKMPENTNKATEDKPGSYSITTLLTMSGDWRVKADVTLNAKIHTFTFDFKVK